MKLKKNKNKIRKWVIYKKLKSKKKKLSVLISYPETDSILNGLWVERDASVEMTVHSVQSFSQSKMQSPFVNVKSVAQDVHVVSSEHVSHILSQRASHPSAGRLLLSSVPVSQVTAVHVVGLLHAVHIPLPMIEMANVQSIDDSQPSVASPLLSYFPPLHVTAVHPFVSPVVHAVHVPCATTPHPASHPSVTKSSLVSNLLFEHFTAVHADVLLQAEHLP